MSQTPSHDTRRAAIRKAWLRWTWIFVPLFAVLMIAVTYLGMGVMLPVLLLILGAVLLYQRYLNKCTWHSIIWGVYANKE